MGGCLTGPISTTGVSSRTFSIGALEESSCGGSNKVTFLAILRGRDADTVQKIYRPESRQEKKKESKIRTSGLIWMTADVLIRK